MLDITEIYGIRNGVKKVRRANNSTFPGTVSAKTQGNDQTGNVKVGEFYCLFWLAGFGLYLFGSSFSILHFELWSSATGFSSSQELYMSSKSRLDIHGSLHIKKLLNIAAHMWLPAQHPYNIYCWKVEGCPRESRCPLLTPIGCSYTLLGICCSHYWKQCPDKCLSWSISYISVLWGQKIWLD